MMIGKGVMFADIVANIQMTAEHCLVWLAVFTITTELVFKAEDFRYEGVKRF